MFGGDGIFNPLENLERDMASHRQAALIVVCLLLIASFFANYFLP